jgi:DNA-binding beta-propeller fold protein YncE
MHKQAWTGLVLAFAFLLPASAAYVNFEGKQTRPICLSPDGTRLFAVNTPDARLSVFDVSQPWNPFLLAEIPVGLEPVSVNARNNDEVWVVNEVSDSVSIVSVSNRLVLDTLAVKDEPADVVFAGGRAFVSCARNSQIAVFDAASHAALTNLPVAGASPRSLAVSLDGTEVFAAFALSGNRTTLVPASNAPSQITNGSPPINPALAPPPQVGLIVDAADPAWTNFNRFQMPDYDIVAVSVGALQVSRYFSGVGTVLLGLAVNPASGDVFAANTDARNLVHFEPGVRGHIVDNRLARVSLGTGAVTNFDLNAGLDYATLPNPSALSNALAQPTALVFAPDGTQCFVAAFGSDRVARLDAASGAVLSRVELCPTAAGAAADPRNKRGPRGLALNSGAQCLYVLNRIANTISIIRTSDDTLLKEIPVGGFDPTPAVIRQGRGFLYDAKLSGNGTAACAACHVDGEMDMIAWDLGDPQGSLVTNHTVLPLGGTFFTNTSVFHPMKGPMTTQTLRGLSTLEPFHWRGDRTNFLHFNGAFGSLLGGTPLASADISAYRDFINTIAFEPNPNQNLDRTLPASFAGGNPRIGFTNFTVNQYVAGLSCNSCHALPTGTAKFIVAASALQESQDFKVPHLRNIYQKTALSRAPGASSVGGFGFLHDGTFDSIPAFLSQPVFGTFATNGPIKTNLNAFLQCMDTGIAPAVGYTRTVGAANVADAAVVADWSLLEAQAQAGTNLDLIVKGTLGGKLHGLLYQPGANVYRADTTNLAAFTRAQLVSAIQSGDRLTLMGVPVGAGQRMGIDRDENGILDADEPAPALQIAIAPAAVTLRWPLTPAGFALEGTTDLAFPNWSAQSGPVEMLGGWNVISNTPQSAPQYFRLRSLAP